MKPTHSQTITPEVIAAAAQPNGMKIGNKQVIASARIQHPGEQAVNWYTLEDGSEIIRDDTNKFAAWPDEIPAALKAKREGQ